MAASMFVSQSPSIVGTTNVFFFVFLSHTASAKLFGQAMGTKRFVVKLGHTLGFKSIVQIYQFHTCMALPYLLVKL